MQQKPQKLQKRVPWLFLLTGCLCLAACGSLLESPQATSRMFMLSPLEASAATRSHAELMKLKIRVVPGLDTDRLVTVADNVELNHFAAARWPDNLPEFSRSLVERSLKAHGWMIQDQTKQAAGREICELSLEIEQFLTLLDPAGQPASVQVSWDGLYHCGTSPLPVRVSESVPVGQKDITGVVRAYQQGFDLAMRSTIRQIDFRQADQNSH